MKTLIYIIYIAILNLLISCVGNNTQRIDVVVDINEIGFENNIPHIIGRDEPYTGRVVSYYDNGNLKFEQNYFKGLRIGEFVRYYENGNPEFKLDYDNSGSEDSPYSQFRMSEYFDDEGKLMHYYETVIFGGDLDEEEESRITSKHKFNLYTAFILSNDQIIYLAENYRNSSDHDDPYTGYLVEFHHNGILKSKYYVKNGKYEDAAYLFNDLGDLEYKCMYKNGKKNGLLTYYHTPYEIVQSISNCKDDNAHGNMVEYYEDGSLKNKSTYFEGKWIKSTSYSLLCNYREEYTAYN